MSDAELALSILHKIASDMGGGWIAEAYSHPNDDPRAGHACFDTSWIDLTAAEFQLYRRLRAEADPD